LLGKTVSHYEILGFLDRGGMGAVHRARDVRLDREVAVKVLSHERAADEEFECNLLAQTQGRLSRVDEAALEDVDHHRNVVRTVRRVEGARSGHTGRLVCVQSHVGVVGADVVPGLELEQAVARAVFVLGVAVGIVGTAGGPHLGLVAVELVGFQPSLPVRRGSSVFPGSISAM